MNRTLLAIASPRRGMMVSMQNVARAANAAKYPTKSIHDIGLSFVTERVDDRPSEHEHADRNALAHHWNRQVGPVVAELLEFARLVARIGQHIVNVDRPAFHRRASGDRSWSRRNRMLLCIFFELAG